MSDDKAGLKKTYTNGEVSIVWQAGKCSHSGNCVRGLPNVFRPKEKPWIDITAAESDALAAQVDRCPSGALSWFRNADGPGSDAASAEGGNA